MSIRQKDRVDSFSLQGIPVPANPDNTQGRDAQKEALERAPPVEPHSKSFAVLAVAVLGVVYGDIGTSPIYALRETFAGKNPIPVTPDNVLGVLSLVFWALILIISVKYMIFVLRADNRGEGGTFALMALLRPDRNQDRTRRRLLILLGILGASMLYGGAMITPAISVLSAVEGLQVAAPHLDRFVIAITAAILFALFAVQRHGTAKVGAIFGPLTLVWFAVLAILGIRGILQAPEVLLAVDPRHAVRYFANNGMVGYFAIYAIFLVTTGGEALYADLGHFGRSPIRKVWIGFVLPSLLLNYFGQGALLIVDPAGSIHPFYHLAPSWALLPLVFLATAATCIASQAVITGAFSMTRQAVLLGLLPALTVNQTSADARGQIYMPAVNWFLMFAAISLVLTFQSSSNLAAAYGVAVNSTMAITTVLAFNVARERGGWSLPAALAFLIGFLFIDLGFLGANLMTIPNGGWLPLLIGATLFVVMTTWRRGTSLLNQHINRNTPDVETFIGQVTGTKIARVPGTAAFFTGRLDQTPPALQKLVSSTGVLHELVILITVVIEPIARIEQAGRIEFTAMDAGFHRLVLRYGFMQGPNVPSDLASCAELGLAVNLHEIHYFIGQTDLLAGRKRHGMIVWRDRLFVRMAINSQDATAYYQIPSGQVMKVGLQVGI
ncbi:MAG TPA: KUP/HAK/KT family potassium transporter [Woeseiaceae bacterium]|nr:KUP/HAK/KT family potassium transporter [Woeseiaceae bacterium]